MRFRNSLGLVGVSLLLLSFHAGARSNSRARIEASRTPASGAAARFVDAPDMKALLQRVYTPQGIVDPRYDALVAGPSRYLSDFFGIQAIRDVGKTKIEHDFVPKYASVERETKNTLELRFQSGWLATFYVNASLQIGSSILPLDHVYISGERYPQFTKHLQEFLGILAAEHLEASYLIPNPHYADELATERKLLAKDPPVPVAYDPHLDGFEASANAILLFPDPVHGNRETYDRFWKLLATRNFDWLGMEMLPSSLDKQLQKFIEAPENSSEYGKARKALLDYFSNAWNVFGDEKSPEENHYFKVVELMRRRKKRVYGLETTSLEYIAFRYGQAPFGAAVRNDLWAAQVPRSGQGVVFGGSSHFTLPGGANFQDFVQQRDPGMKLFSVRKIEVRGP